MLISEREAAGVARQKGFQLTGTLGVLILAAERGLLDLPDAFYRPRSTSFYYSESLMQRLLSQHKSR